MTVESIVGCDVGCVWFDKGQVRRETFPLHVLNKDDSNLTIVLNLDEQDAKL